MSQFDRRDFLKIMGLGATSSMLPDNIARALEIPASSPTGTIKDVQHIVILTQENRSFDHYFGVLRGVRGFNDPRAAKLPNGKPVWVQPNGAGELLPFRPDVESVGQMFLSDPPHSWNNTHGAWNWGKYNDWIANKGQVAMTYHTRKDIPYHYALADAFTVCDAYYCSVMGGTDTNRYHLWTGWCGNDGQGGGPVIFNDEAGYAWHTFPERLQSAGITWKVYQDIGDGLNADNGNWWGWTGDAFIGNYGDNSLLYFHQYQNAQPGDPLYDNARTGTEIKAQGRDPHKLLEDFRADVLNGTLPQISYIAAPEAYTEHPNWPANWGAWYVSQVMDALVANPEVWSKTVLFINFDEEGGFFDHMVPPTPPMDATQGGSTVDTLNEIYPGNPQDPRQPVPAPYGLGIRVPMLVVSPWSKGGWVNSQVFDHTSVIHFIEARFGDEHPGLAETNITPWRRAVAGDLTSAFDFSKANARKVKLPKAASYLPTDLVPHPNDPLVPPTLPLMPHQETGVRPARALPYALHAHGSVQIAKKSFAIDFDNIGQATAVFQVRSGHELDAPRCYTVEPGKQLEGVWNIAAGGTTEYDLSVYGPNGFYRGFKGGVEGHGRANLDVQASYDEQKGNIALTIVNLTGRKLRVSILDQYTGKVFQKAIPALEAVSRSWSLRGQYGWYDLVVTVAEDAGFEYHLAGHVENGKDSISDPAMGGLI